MKKILVLFAVISLSFPIRSQQLAAFNDNINNFWVFEAGQFQKIEHLEIQSHQIGGLLIAYMDNGSNLKVYRNGQVETLMTGDPIKYHTTDYLLGYSMYEQLNVYDNGDIKLLSMEADGYVVQDSLIAWHNRIQQTIQVYYNNEIYTLEDGLIYNPIQGFKLGDNTVAYVHSSSKELKLFYHGEIIILDDYVENLFLEAGRDIVAFIDLPDMAFNVFFKGELITLENFQPKSFQVGDEFVVYIDNLGHLKYFDGGEVITISTYEPQFYTVTDRVLVYEEQGFFKTFCNGQVYIVERYVPSTYKIDWNTIAYLDENRFVKAFQPCEHISVSYEIVKELMLYRDLIIYVEGINLTSVYFMGQVFKP